MGKVPAEGIPDPVNELGDLPSNTTLEPEDPSDDGLSLRSTTEISLGEEGQKSGRQNSSKVHTKKMEPSAPIEKGNRPGAPSDDNMGQSVTKRKTWVTWVTMHGQTPSTVS